MNTQETKKKKKERRPPQREIALASKSRERKPTLMKSSKKSFQKGTSIRRRYYYFFKNNILSLSLLLHESALLHRIPRTTTRGEEEEARICPSPLATLTDDFFNAIHAAVEVVFRSPHHQKSFNDDDARDVVARNFAFKLRNVVSSPEQRFFFAPTAPGTKNDVVALCWIFERKKRRSRTTRFYRRWWSRVVGLTFHFFAFGRRRSKRWWTSSTFFNCFRRFRGGGKCWRTPPKEEARANDSDALDVDDDKQHQRY